MLSDWLVLWLTRRARRTHLRTDPTCSRYRAPRPRSPLDAAHRGVNCLPCLMARSVVIAPRRG